MNRRNDLLVLQTLLTTLAMLFLMQVSWASPPNPYKEPNLLEFKPVTPPTQPGPVDLRLRFGPPDSYDGDGTFKLRIAWFLGKENLRTEQREVTAHPDKPFETLLPLVVDPNSISGMRVYIRGAGFYTHSAAFFIHRGDSVEFWQGWPGAPRGPRQTERSMSDSLNFSVTVDTEEQLQEALRILGQMPDSSLGKPIAIRSTLGKLWALSHLGLKVLTLDVYRGDDPAEFKGGSWIRPQKKSASSNDTIGDPDSAKVQ